MTHMTMADQLDKRRWVEQLWEETEHDEAMRDFVFGDVLDQISEVLEAEHEAANEIYDDERREEIREELDLEIRAEMIDDPPIELVDSVKRILQGQIDDKTTELELEIVDLREQLRKLKQGHP